MVSLRPEAEFRTLLPDDLIEDEEDIVAFAGRNVVEAIGVMLSALGYEVSEPIYAGEHGWELDVCAKGRRFWLQVSRMDGPNCRLSALDMTWRFWRRHPSFGTFLTQLDAELRRDGRFEQIGWLRDWDDETRSPHPVVTD